MIIDEYKTQQLAKLYFKPPPIWEMISGTLWQEIQSTRFSLKYNPKQVIYGAGSYPRGLYIIRKGYVKLSIINQQGAEQIIYFQGKDEIFGHRLIASNEPSPVYMIAISECELDCIPKADVERYLKSSKELSYTFMNFIAKEFSVFVNKISYFAQRSASERLALGLLVLHESINSDAQTPAPLHFSRKDLASYVGIAPENLIRQISGWKNEHIIETKGKSIWIKDFDALSKIARIE